jgi:LAS superfamily LD-carboxypeptidase LdcB
MIEAAENELVVMGRYRQTSREVRLRTEAAAALLSLMTQARADGVAIIPISGFRTVA